MIAWTVIPALAIPNLPRDALEGYAWGREWPLGTYKHPPLQAWILQTLALLSDRAHWAPFLANQVAVTVAFWAIWQTGRRVLARTEAGEAGALIAALLPMAIPYYNFMNPDFNPNVLQIPFWALSGWSFHRAVRENRMIDWLALGLWSVAGLYTKYSMVLILAAWAGLLVFHPDGRKRLLSPGPWLAALTALLLLSPHLLWLFQHDFLPFTYAVSRLMPWDGGAAFLVAPVHFAFWECLLLLPASAIFVASFGPGRWLKRKPQWRSFDEMFVIAGTFGPFLVLCIIASLTGSLVHYMWATPFWNFLGIWAVLYCRPALQPEALHRFACVGAAVFLTGLAGFVGVDVGGPWFTHNATNVNFPGRSLAMQISEAWRQRNHTPLRYVSGSSWFGGNIAYYAPDRPHLLIDGNYQISPWVSAQDIREYGGVVVWCASDCGGTSSEEPAYLRSLFPDAEIQSVLSAPQQTGARVAPAKLGWAIVPSHLRQAPE